MKNQALFFSKDKSKKLKCRLLQFFFCALRVKYRKSLTFQIFRENTVQDVTVCIHLLR